MLQVELAWLWLVVEVAVDMRMGAEEVVQSTSGAILLVSLAWPL